MPGAANIALQSVADVCEGLSLAATSRLAAGGLRAAGVPLEQQLLEILDVAAAEAQSKQEDAKPGVNAVKEQSQLQWALAAAAVQALRQQRHVRPPAAATAVIEKLLLPQLAQVAAEQQHELLQAVAELVACCSCWHLGLVLVQAACGTEPPSSGELPAAPAATQLQPEVRARLAAAIIHQALSASGPEVVQPEAACPAVVLWHAATQTLHEVLELLLAEPPPLPQRAAKRGDKAGQAANAMVATAQLLLPSSLQASAAVGQETGALQQLWNACK